MKSWLQHAIDEFNKIKYSDGDLLSHQWLEWALKLPIPTDLSEVQECQFTAMNRIDAFRAYLLTNRKIALQNIKGKGYRIVPPREQAEFAAKTALAQIVKGLNNGTKIMTHTRYRSLTSDEKTRHTNAEVRLAGIGQIIKNQRKSVFKIFAPKQIP